MVPRRFTVRKEYFGSLVYDRERMDYIPFDAEATAVFRETAAGMPIEEVYSKFCAQKNSEQTFKTFVALCQSIGLLDENGVFSGDFIDNQASEEQKCLSAPLKVHLQITNECPLKCRHCSQVHRDPSPRELSPKDIMHLIDDLARTGVKELVFGGGDPFCKEDLISLVAYAHSKGISPSISSSGLFVSRAAAKKLSETPLKQIRISFDGSSEKSYDYYRGKGTYRRAVRGIKTIREIFSCPLVIHSVIMKTNIGELLSLFRAVQKMEADIWSVDFFRPLGSASTLSNFVLSPDEAALVCRTLRRFSESSDIKIRIPAFPRGSAGRRLYEGFGCAAGITGCHIDSEGNVKPCGFFPQSYIAGNIRSASIRDIWLSSSVFRELRTLQGNDSCRTCPSYSSCRGGCRARCICGGLSPDSRDPLCPYAGSSSDLQ
ncbi:MAG: radical SAM protein [bacterium]|nr:radical SAM protein [bacterium]